MTKIKMQTGASTNQPKNIKNIPAKNPGTRNILQKWGKQKILIQDINKYPAKNIIHSTRYCWSIMTNILGKRLQMGFAALVLAASALLSRLMGLIRDKVISWQFGAGNEADLYFAAFVVPDIINYLLAGGFMSITIIPILARCFKENEDDAWNFFSCIFLWMAIASIILTIGGIVFANSLASLVAPGFSAVQTERLAFFMRIILPAQIFFLCGACFTALLFLRRQFSVPALTPLIYNGAILAFGLILPMFYADSLSGRNNIGMTGYCVGVTIGALIGAFLLPMAVVAKDGLKLHLVFKHRLFGKFLFIALPLMLGQTVVMLDEQFLRVFGSLVGEGWVSLLNYGRRIAQVPIGLMGQAVAVASYPFLVQLLADNDKIRFDETLRKAIFAGTGLIIPCAFMMIAGARPILEIIFQGGKFGLEETLAALPLTQIMLLPAPLWIIYMVLVRGYYALGDTLTPAITGTLVTLVCIPLYYWLAVPLGAWAIPALSGLSILGYVIWLVLIWIKRNGSGAFTGFWKLALQSVFCSAPAAIGAWFCMRYISTIVPPMSFISACITLMCGSMLFAFLYLPCARFFMPEIYLRLTNKIGKLFHLQNVKR